MGIKLLKLQHGPQDKQKNETESDPRQEENQNRTSAQYDERGKKHVMRTTKTKNRNLKKAP